MNRRTGVWVGAGVLGLMSAVSATGCGTENDRSSEDYDDAKSLGDLSLGLVLPDGSEVNSVNYVITRNGVTVRSDVMQVGANGVASVTISGLEAGTGYHVVLTAPRGDAGVACSGEGDFTVVSNMTANVNVLLQCDDLSAVDGTITVNGTFNICPKVTSTSASPTSVFVGSSTTLSATARDRDAADVVSFAWSAANGTFSSPSSANTTYTCASAGAKTLTISVSDGPSRGCTRSATVSITCVAANMDAGVVDGGLIDSGLVDAGVTSSQAAYVVPTLSGVTTKAFLTTGDGPQKPDGGVYQMAGTPDGLGAFDNGDGTFTLLSNHEFVATAGGVRAHGAKGAFVSKWIVRKADQRVLSGSDLIQTVNVYNTTTQTYAPQTYAFGRFCSADLALKSAWFDAATNTGFNGQLFLNGEEGEPGRAWAHGLDGVTYELPLMGRQAWENIVASPASGAKTVVIGTDDTTPGQVFVYVGSKNNTGTTSIDRAGLTNGLLYGVKVPGTTAEVNGSVIPEGRFELAQITNYVGQSISQLDSAAGALGVTTFLRPEDGAWDPSNPNDYYFVTTNGLTANSRLWRLRFDDVKNPTTGGVIKAMLNGSEGHRMLDNITIDPRGHIVAVEDVGNDVRLGKIWRYTISSGSWVELAAHDMNRFLMSGSAYLTQDEEASGIIDATALLGAGYYIFDTQAHYTQAGDLVEGGQFQVLYDPGSL